jgi:hypothetical protein
MQPFEPSGLVDEVFIRYAAQFISEGGMPLEWEKEMLKRYLYYFALIQEIDAHARSETAPEQLYIL